MANRYQLRGAKLLPQCYDAKIVHESNGDIVCGGFHKDDESFFLSEDDVIDSKPSGKPMPLGIGYERVR